jgi:hypothetical protein
MIHILLTTTQHSTFPKPSENSTFPTSGSGLRDDKANSSMPDGGVGGLGGGGSGGGSEWKEGDWKEGDWNNWQGGDWQQQQQLGPDGLPVELGPDGLPIKPKEKENYETTGLLAMEDQFERQNAGGGDDKTTFRSTAESAKTVAGKVTIPADCKKPDRLWRLYCFVKDKEEPKILHLHRQAHFLLGEGIV